jgi:hypothetical protein
MMIRIFLALQALSFAAFGLYSLANPIGMAAGLGVDVSGPNGAYELRGIYGGVSLAASLMCGAGALRPGLRLPALWFLIVYMGGYVFARAAALLLGPPPTPGFAVFIAFETVSLLLAIAALRAAYRA